MQKLKSYLWILILGWTMVLAFSGWWNINNLKNYNLELALTTSRITFQKDILYRQWATLHGGIYVPISDLTPPNPYLAHIPERDIQTPSGKRLTLMNPAYMTRQVYEFSFGEKIYEPLGHITSLQPLRPENAPDDWETAALQSFANGQAEASGIVKIDERPYFRFMKPFYTNEGCVKCHTDYKVGDLRGGISVAVSLEPFLFRQKQEFYKMGIWHGLIWIIGLSGILIMHFRLKQSWAEQIVAKNLLEQNNQRLQLLLETTEEMLTNDSPAQAVENIARRLMATIGCDLFFIFILDNETERLHLYSFAGIPEEKARHIQELALGEDICGTVAQDRCRIICEDIPNSTDQKTALIKSYGAKAYACFPLLAQDNLFGTFSFGTRQRLGFSQEEIDLMHSLANQVAILLSRKQTEKTLFAAQERLNLALDSAAIGTFDFNPGNGKLTWDDRSKKLWGIAPEEQVDYDRAMQLIHPEDRHSVAQSLEAALIAGTDNDFEAEYRIIWPDGSIHWCVSKGRCYFSNTNLEAKPRVSGINLDITKRKQTEQSLRQALAEKNVLLQEVHHRVKNNLQVVNSLLSLQASTIQEPNFQAAFQDTQGRVWAMALLHETLYQSKNLATVNFSSYVNELCYRLLRSFGEKATWVKIEERVPPMSLPLEESVSCGLIINELITNAIKHGLANKRHGKILIELRQLTDRQLSLSVSDNGTGLPADFDPASASSLGLRLVTNLAGSLDGHLIIEPFDGAGATFRVSFPVPNKTTLEAVL